MKRYYPLLDKIFPPYCLNCEVFGAYLCKKCTQQLLSHPEICIGCHRPTKLGRCCHNCRKDRPLDGVIIGFQYSELIKSLITQSKYQKKYAIIDFLSEKLIYHIISHPILQPLLVKKQLTISYIPMHWYKEYFLRGFNQSKLLAQRVASKINIPCKTLTRKTKHTKAQMKKTREQRLLLNEGIFTITQQNITGTILLVDDITTTGTTLKIVAQTIKKQHPDVTIWGAIIARHH